MNDKRPYTKYATWTNYMRRGFLDTRPEIKKSDYSIEEFRADSMNALRWDLRFSGNSISKETLAMLDADNEKTTSETVKQNRMRYAGLIMLYVEKTILERGEGVNVFMPDRPFCDWLVDCVGKLEIDLADHLAELCAAFKTHYFAFHFPTTNQLCSVMAFVSDKNSTKLNGEKARYCEGIFVSASVDNGHELTYSMTTLGAVRENKPSLEYYMRMMIGLGMYVHCFPETIKHGMPDDLKHPAQHDRPGSVTIEFTPKVRTPGGGTHASPCGHFRVAHSRHLRSEKFTHKRGMIVPVKWCWVGPGRTETVLSPEEVSIEPA